MGVRGVYTESFIYVPKSIYIPSIKDVIEEEKK